MLGRTANRETQQRGDDRWASFESEAMPHIASLFRVANWLTRDRSEAEDLVQETLTEALTSFHRFVLGTNCRAWLIAIMYHRQSKRRRTNMHLHLVSDSQERILETLIYEPSTPQDVTDEEVLQALERLPRSYQEVVTLADVEEMSYKEIAIALDIPVGTVMSRLSRGRKLLRVELASYAQARGFARRLTADSEGEGIRHELP